jgi:hypothetical protein
MMEHNLLIFVKNKVIQSMFASKGNVKKELMINTMHQ